MLMLMPMSEAALKIAIEKAGGHAKLGRALGISGAAISQWTQCPPLRVLAVEELTGVPRHELRPDLYPPVPAKPEAA
ncbi:transcriptional regulator [Methylobacterium komagatae]|uniref:Transcriptional regulator n=1 Tax=Methylobacterium komagatae TaxID=374425 RepID=A0ABW2BL52_9HYPH